ncbi:MAG: fluoroquinolone export ABC transporter permease subunit [Desulfitobacteriaceae bacterium]
MRIKSLLWGDIRFQFKYGFYFIYLVFSVLYICLLFAFPEVWREKAALLMIFSDPAAMGLYFMGAIVLFEKSERVLDSIAISPVKPSEYTFSKLCSIGIISTAVGLIIGYAGGVVSNILEFSLGVFLCSCLFSAVGLIIACKISTLNQFIIATIPAEILINIPTIAWLFGYKRSWLLLHPGVCMLEICTGGNRTMPALILLLAWVVIFAVLAGFTVEKMLKSLGGVKL